MIHKKVIVGALLLLGISLTGLHAQETVSAAGGNDSGSGGSVSYTVGQVLYTTIIGTNGSVAQGVQQPYEISVVSGLEEASGINLVCSAWPNPAFDILTLKVENQKTEKLSFQLYDINGKLLENRKITSRETSISMGNYIPAVYFLKVTSNSKEAKIFRIVKNQKP
jgi:hypothetical protein